MKSNGLSFHHPLAFWFGCAAIVAGVLGHLPMFAMAAPAGYRMAGMPMDLPMMIGMALIPAGLLLAGYGLAPRLAQIQRTLHSDVRLQFHVADSAALNRRHWTLVLALLVALAVDVMKPATLGFVLPGMTREYAISEGTGGLLALVALTGTTIGSIVWGRLADTLGRRAAILLSALMFIGTAICGAMPSFAWNLVMCFLMGASAGGLLPITFTLMAEMIPAAHRGWLLVALGGVGTWAGYMLAAGAASLLEPVFSWRALWLLGLPTGALIIFMDRYIPESPRFLANAGLVAQARAVLARYSGVVDAVGAPAPEDAAGAQPSPRGRIRDLLRGPHAPLTLGLLICGTCWGLVNFGFLLWLPTALVRMGMDAGAASALLARSALLALPGVLLVIVLYHRWSSIRSLVMFVGLTAACLAAFVVMGVLGVDSETMIVAATAALLVSASGVIAMLIPYAAEIYPVQLRGTGSGLVAASSKFGGILGALAGVAGLFGDMTVAAFAIALPTALSAVLLWRSGVETRGYGLESIQQAFGQKRTGGIKQT